MFLLNSEQSLCEMDRHFLFGGTINYGDSYWEFLFRHFKVIRLNGILNDAVGLVRAHIGQGVGYCYIAGRGPTS